MKFHHLIKFDTILSPPPFSLVIHIVCINEVIDHKLLQMHHNCYSVLLLLSFLNFPAVISSIIPLRTNIFSSASFFPRNETKRLIGIDYVKTRDKLRIELRYSIQKRSLFARIFRKRKSRPLVFIHGSGGGAWIFEEHWLPFFSKIGYDSYAVGLRGSYGTGLPTGDTSKTVKISQHISDLKCVLNYFKKRYGSTKNPIFIGHSFGGLILMKLLEDSVARKSLHGAGWLCSVPPSGQGRMAVRFLFTRFINTVNIIRGFALNQTDRPALNRLLFFDNTISDVDLKRYMQRLKQDAIIGEDMAEIEQSLPSKHMTAEGTATWTLENRLETFVLGSKNDYIVDPPAIRETAKFVGCKKPVLIVGPGHNVMLGGYWQVAAAAISDWLRQKT